MDSSLQYGLCDLCDSGVRRNKNMKITKEDCYKAVSDLINENYPYFDDCEDTGASIQYILGLNDMARYLAEMMNSAEEECDDNRRKERA